MSKLKCYILVGIPGSGKSTWVKKQDLSNTMIVSTDNYIEAYADSMNKTYSEIFNEIMPLAVKHMTTSVYWAIDNNKNIIWDQTSTTVLTRMKKIRMIPDNYDIIAVVFPTPEKEELQKRLANRPGKIIPEDVITNMIKNYEKPSIEEGFHNIEYVR